MSTPLAFLDPRSGRPPIRREPRRLALDPRLAPIHTMDLELAAPASVGAAGRYGTDWSRVSGALLALVRMHGTPLGFVQAWTESPTDTLSTLMASAVEQLAVPIAQHVSDDGFLPPKAERTGPVPIARCMRRRLAALAGAPPISVVVVTRERPAELARCLDSLTRMPYPELEIIVVDRATGAESTAGGTEQTVRERYEGTVGYLREPGHGIAAARNRGLHAAGGRIVAFTDDDATADREWAAALAEAFNARDDVGCVTGLMAPANLDTPAQVMLTAEDGCEGILELRCYAMREPGADPLFPFTVGRLGSGANMAFDAELLRAFGGFDRATGGGSAARGGDDLLAFFRTLTAGRSLVHQPSAIIWRHCPATLDELTERAHDSGVGLGAYLTAAMVHEPGMAPGMIRRVPRGIAYELRSSRPSLCDPGVKASRLAAAQRRGLIRGPFAYARGRFQR